MIILIIISIINRFCLCLSLSLSLSLSLRAGTLDGTPERAGVTATARPNQHAAVPLRAKATATKAICCSTATATRASVLSCQGMGLVATLCRVASLDHSALPAACSLG